MRGGMANISVIIKAARKMTAANQMVIENNSQCGSM